MRPFERRLQEVYDASSGLVDHFVMSMLDGERRASFTDPQLALMVSKVLAERIADHADMAGVAAVCLVRMMRAEIAAEEASRAGQ